MDSTQGLAVGFDTLALASGTLMNRCVHQGEIMNENKRDIQLKCLIKELTGDEEAYNMPLWLLYNYKLIVCHSDTQTYILEELYIKNKTMA